VKGTRRIGLFLAGDVATGVRSACAELAIDAPKTPADLARVCDAQPIVADLVRLAVRPEYADARWRIPPEGSAHVKLSSGQIRLK